MPLVDSEQLDKQQHRVVLSQSMFFAPLGNGLGRSPRRSRVVRVWALDITSRAEAGR